jgi:hypothetical protein
MASRHIGTVRSHTLFQWRWLKGSSVPSSRAIQQNWGQRQKVKGGPSNSEAGYGCIAAVHAKEQTGNAEPTIGSVGIQWLMANRYERHVNVKRLTVVREQTH